MKPWRLQFLLAILAPAICPGQSLRAVVVGINDYQHKFEAPALLPRLPLQGTSTRHKWENLDGALSDAREMREVLVGRFGFEPGNIQMLLDQQATGEAILTAIQKHLIDAAKPGDVSVFYYAGHGSQIRNTKSDETDGLDETLVPADGISGNADIRDRELARIYRAALAKGIRLTVILDSCHSGSAARGAVRSAGKARRIENDGRFVEDPPDRDSTGRKLPNPEDEGALVLSAAQDYEPAYERVTESGPHGLFSWALMQVLRTSPADERADRIFQRVRALMQAEGATQEPVMGGRGRASLTLLGLPAASGHQVTAAAIVAEGRPLKLQAGAAANLTVNCEFIRQAQGGVRVKISKVLGVNLSEAVVIEGNAAEIQSGDLFVLDRWAMDEVSALRVYAPSGGNNDAAGVARSARAAATALGVRWIADPTVESPDAVLDWDGAKWRLNGASVNVAQISAALKESRYKTLFVNVPLIEGGALPKTAGNIVFVDSVKKAHYVLAGRAEGSKVEYAWILPGIAASDSAKASALPLPLRTDWLEMSPGIGKVLSDRAMSLARVRAWILLTPPPGELQFPYSLVLRQDGQIAKGKLAAGGKYKLFLEAADAGKAARAWVYVFAIDSHGKSTLLFPGKGQGNVGNRLPLEGEAGKSIALTQESYDLEIAPPYGVDSYFLLVSKDALANPDVLDFDGVREAARGAGSLDPLSKLLIQVGEATRGQRPTSRATWTIQRETFTSAADN